MFISRLIAKIIPNARLTSCYWQTLFSGLFSHAFHCGSAYPEKFYKYVSVSQTFVKDEEYPVFEILLDHRKLRTANGNQFYIPNEALAHAVAKEWDSQCNTIKRYTMHLTTLCNRVLDNQIGPNKESVVENIVQYALTDTICFRYREPDDLVLLQSTAWDPILDWVKLRYNLEPTLSTTLTSLIDISRENKDTITAHFSSYNIWGVVGIQTCVENLKSVFLTLAAMDGFISANKAVQLSQLEVLYQVKRWGDISSYHDVQTAELNCRVSAALLLTMLSRQT